MKNAIETMEEIFETKSLTESEAYFSQCAVLMEDEIRE